MYKVQFLHEYTKPREKRNSGENESERFFQQDIFKWQFEEQLGKYVPVVSKAMWQPCVNTAAISIEFRGTLIRSDIVMVAALLWS